MKKAVKTVFLFDNGVLAACDDRGEQIPELQRPPMSFWATHAVALGYDLSGATLETQSGWVFRFEKSPDGCWGTEPLGLRQ